MTVRWMLPASVDSSSSSNAVPAVTHFNVYYSVYNVEKVVGAGDKTVFCGGVGSNAVSTDDGEKCVLRVAVVGKPSDQQQAELTGALIYTYTCGCVGACIVYYHV